MRGLDAITQTRKNTAISLLFPGLLKEKLLSRPIEVSLSAWDNLDTTPVISSQDYLDASLVHTHLHS
jgi:hypothetical protein